MSIDSQNSSSHQKNSRIEKAKRALKRSEVDAPMLSMELYKLATDDSKRALLTRTLRSVGLILSESDEEFLVIGVQFALAELIESRNALSAQDESDIVRKLHAASQEMELSLRAISEHKKLREPVSDILRGYIRFMMLNFLKKQKWKSTEVLESYLRKVDSDISFLPTVELLRIFTAWLSCCSDHLANTFYDSNRIKNHAEYKFVDQVAKIWYKVTNSVPTLSRNDYETTTSRRKSGPISSSRLFEPFIKAVVPAPQIGDEIIRSVLDAFRLKTQSGS